MKKCTYIIIFLIIAPIRLIAQDNYNDYPPDPYAEYNPYDPYGSAADDEGDYSDSLDTEKKSIKPIHRTWKWVKDGVVAKKHIEDSTLDGFHITNPMIRRSQSNTYLAPTPSPYQSNIFILRNYGEKLYYHNLFRDFMFKETDAPLYNTTTPYTYLIYSSAGSKGRNETTLNVTHTQNITPDLNAGFRYNTIKSDGRYLNQTSRAYDLSFFSNFENKRFAVNFFINQNNLHFNENGGVADRSSIKDTTDKADNILVNMESGTENEFRNFNFYTGLQLKLGLYTTIVIKDTIIEERVKYEKELEMLDSIATAQGSDQFTLIADLEKQFIADETKKYDKLPEYIQFVLKDGKFQDAAKTKLQPGFLVGLLTEGEIEKIPIVRYDTIDEQHAKILFSVKGEDNFRNFIENPVNADFFKNNFCSSSTSKDKYHDKIWDLSAKLVVNKFPQLKKTQSGIYGGVDLETRYNRQKFFADTANLVPDNISYDTYKHQNAFINAGLFNNDSLSLLIYNIDTRFCFAGKYNGDFSLNGNIKQYLSSKMNSYLHVKALYDISNLDRYWKLYAGNHDYWKNDHLEKEKRLNVQVRYVNDRLRTEVGAGMTNIDGYMMMDSTLTPRQITKPFSTYTLFAKEHFKVWKMNFIGSVYLQKSMEEDIVSLPLVSAYSSTYIEVETRNKALRAQIGFDVKYDTKFYADNYHPSTMTFYQQRKEKQGNVIYSDVFANFRVSRCNIFAKYEHFDYYLRNGGNYFSAYDYPVNPPLFRIGVRWSFFD